MTNSLTEPFNGCRPFSSQFLIRIDCFMIQMPASEYHQISGKLLEPYSLPIRTICPVRRDSWWITEHSYTKGAVAVAKVNKPWRTKRRQHAI